MQIQVRTDLTDYVYVSPPSLFDCPLPPPSTHSRATVNFQFASEDVGAAAVDKLAADTSRALHNTLGETSFSGGAGGIKFLAPRDGRQSTPRLPHPGPASIRLCPLSFRRAILPGDMAGQMNSSEKSFSRTSPSESLVFAWARKSND